MIENVLKNIEYNSDLQIAVVRCLNNIFQTGNIVNFEDNSYLFEGVRGKFEGIKNYSICFKFEYYDYVFEFDLAYDQLEFYISRYGKLLKECNLEDFWENSLMIEKFINYLKEYLTKLEIPFNR